MSNDQQYPYGQYGGNGAYGEQGRHGRYGADDRSQGAPVAYDQYGNPLPQQQQSPQPGFGQPGSGEQPVYQEPPQDPGAAQTWEGQTWDTQYQPRLQWQQDQHGGGQGGHGGGQDPYGQQQQQAQAYPQAHPQQAQQQRHQQQAHQSGAAAETAYLPVQGAYPLPPESPATGGAAPGPAAYPPQGTGQGPVQGQGPGQGHGLGQGQGQGLRQGPGQGQAASGPAFTPAPGATPAPAPGADGYSAPTTMGNARITDAQRARAEGRSPIIPPGMQPAGLTAVLGLLLAGGAAVGPYALLVPLVLLQAVTAAGWFRLNGMWPARQGIALAFLGGITADVALLAVADEYAVAAILGTLGVWVLLTVVLQLRSRAGADERMEGLMATVVSAALTIIATGHLAALPDAVVVGGAAVAATTVVRALPLPGAASVVVSLLVAAGAGAVVGGMTDLGGAGTLLGLGAGVCALIGLRAASYDYPSRFVHMTAGVALPLTAAAPAVYLLGRVLG
ncbi:hypothetical protein ACFYYH_26015 [Streptomyces sp. NPDC002018]|uniref:hypothetical protein n=1 Tax=Streptomyces sp. NPDC002018 TaxID=3364629 RepID=UPI00369D44CB